MKPKPSLVLIGCLVCQLLVAQSKDNSQEYKKGYALKGKDTIWCKIIFTSKYAEDARRSVNVLIENEELTFFAGGPITGFGVEDGTDKYDYGVVDVDVSIADRRMASLLFVKKLVAGTIDLYEYRYAITTTKRTTVNGVEQPGSTTITQNFTNYYIAKTDSAAPVLMKPVPLPSYRKKDLEAYISDNAALLSNAEKRFSLKELIALLKEYNSWFLEKKKT